MKNTIMIIHYPDGTKQRIKPQMGWFEGDWYSLAESIARPYYPEGKRIKYILT